MKALVIDASCNNFIVSCVTENSDISLSCCMERKQSELLLKYIDSVLSLAKMDLCNLDFMALCEGPGTFTGLRLSYAALKAINFATGLPIYSVSTLDAYMYFFQKLPFYFLCVIDANNNQFYAKGIKLNREILSAGCYPIQDIMKNLDSEVYICGSSAEIFINVACKIQNQYKFYNIGNNTNITRAIYNIAFEKIKNGNNCVKDYEGPKYLKLSEAEIKQKIKEERTT